MEVITVLIRACVCGALLCQAKDANAGQSQPGIILSGSGGYTPAGDPQVVFWLDAGDPATLFRDEGQTMPARADADIVGAWVDKSSNGWDVSCPAGAPGAGDANKPKLTLNQQNGKPSVRFDGTNDFLRTTAASLQGSSYTFFVVCRRLSWRNLEGILSIYSSDSEHDDSQDGAKSARLGHTGDLGSLSDARDDTLLSQSTHPGDNVTFLFASRYDGASNVAYRNGTAGTTVACAGNFSSERIQLGACSATIWPMMNYEYFEVLIYNTALDHPRRATVENYLNSKWAIY